MREMKDSGVEWIGEMPAKWNLYTVGSLFRIRNEKVNDTDFPPLSVSRGGIVPQMENVAKSDANDNRKMVLKNDFAINSRSDRKQSCGVSLLDGSVSLINTIMTVANKDLISPEYPNYLMKNYGFAEEYYRWGHGIVADLWTTRWQEMKSISLPLPSISEQNEILAVISRKTFQVDALIANVQEQIEKLKSYKQSLITEVVTKGLDPDVPMKDSGVEWIGEIPEHWTMAMFGKFIKTIQTGPFGSQLHSEDYVFEGTPIINPANIQNSRIEVDDSTCISDEKLNDLHQHLSVEGDILFGRRGEMGRCAVVEEGMQVFCGTGCIKIQCKCTLLPKYAILFLQTENVRSYLDLNAVGTTMKNLNISIISRTPIAIPSNTEQHFIVEYITEKSSQIDRLISIKQAKIQKLNAYKKSLIYEYVTGKKEVI